MSLFYFFTITTMTKLKLIQVAAYKTGVSQAQVKAVLNSFIDSIVKTTTGGEKVMIPWFGTFGTKVRKSRKGINPKTGEKLVIPEMKQGYFKFGSTYRRAIRAK